MTLVLLAANAGAQTPRSSPEVRDILCSTLILCRPALLFGWGRDPQLGQLGLRVCNLQSRRGRGGVLITGVRHARPQSQCVTRNCRPHPHIWCQLINCKGVSVPPSGPSLGLSGFPGGLRRRVNSNKGYLRSHTRCSCGNAVRPHLHHDGCHSGSGLKGLLCF